MLKGKTAPVTGPTSGIGLGVATAVATAGANVLPNGFGDAADIERSRSNLAERTQVVREVNVASQASKRFVKVQAFGALVVFLCSSGATSINGASIPMESGWTAR